MKAEITWRTRRFMGIAYKTPDYSRVAFSDGTTLHLDREKPALIFRGAQGEVLSELAVVSDEVDHLYNLSGEIVLSSGRLICTQTWDGCYRFMHEKLGQLTTEWMQADEEGTAGPTVTGVLDSETQKVVMALALAISHKWSGLD